MVRIQISKGATPEYQNRTANGEECEENRSEIAHLRTQNKSRLGWLPSPISISALFISSLLIHAGKVAIVMTEPEFIAKLAAIRRMAERLNVDFDQMLGEVLRRFPADSIKIIRAELERAELGAPPRD